MGTDVVEPDAPVEVFEFGVVVVVFDVGGDGDAGAVVVGGAGLKAISALNSRPIDSVMVSLRAAGMTVHVEV